MEERVAYIRELLKLTPQQEARQKLAGQSWFKTMDDDAQAAVVGKTLACAEAARDKLRTDFGVRTVGEYATALGVQVQHSADPASQFFLHFALFQANPPVVRLTDPSIDLTKKYIADKGLADDFAGVDIAEFALAHELFHRLGDEYPEQFGDKVVAVAECPGRGGKTKQVQAPVLSEVVARRLSQLLLGTTVTASALEAALSYSFKDNQAAMLEQNRQERWQRMIDMFTKLRPGR